ncbi:MAG TPA: hypothetical protein VF575_03365 [Candidatus Saccharimonadales bacterium]|jgi:hypothetical protein
MDALEDLADFYKVFLLSEYAIRIYKIYDAFFADNDIPQEDDHLNNLYAALVIKTDKLLEHPRLAGYRSSRPNIHRSFAGRLNEISKEYDADFKTRLWKFYENANSMVAELAADMGGYHIGDPNIRLFFEDIDFSIKDHVAMLRGLDNGLTKHSEPSFKLRAKIKFNSNTSILTLDRRTCDIPDETLEHYICKLTFKNRNVAALEDDILEKSVKSQNSQRAVYDAMLRVNKKAKAELGIDKLLVYKAAKLRINKKYQ